MASPFQASTDPPSNGLLKNTSNPASTWISSLLSAVNCKASAVTSQSVAATDATATSDFRHQISGASNINKSDSTLSSTSTATQAGTSTAGNISSFLSAPAAPIAHASLLGLPALGPAAISQPQTSSALLVQALQQQQHVSSISTAVPGIVSAVAPTGANAILPATTVSYQTSALPQSTATLPAAGAYCLPGPAGISQFPQTQLLQMQAQAAMAAYGSTTSKPPSMSVHGPSAVKLPPAQSTAPSKVKVLMSYGGASTNHSGGAWEYVGGETRLLGGLNPCNCSYQDLASRIEDEVNMKPGSEVALRYELPGSPGTLVDVRCDADVENMWSEWSDFCSLSGQPTFKLHLYLDRPSTAVLSVSSHSSRNSAGRSSDDTIGSADKSSSIITTTGTSSAKATALADEMVNSGTAAGSAVPAVQQQSPSLATPSAIVTPTPGTGTGGLFGTAASGNSDRQVVHMHGQGQGQGAQQATGPTGQAVMSPLFHGRPESAAAAAAGAGTAAGMNPSDASFDRLLTRVKTVVEIIRPADLRIIRFIGSGGFADCYLAKWLGVEVAVKCLRDLPGAHTSSRAAVKELLREASVLSGLRHPNVLCLYAVALPDQLAIEYGLRAAPAASEGVSGGLNGGGMGAAAAAPASASAVHLPTVEEGQEIETVGHVEANEDKEGSIGAASETTASGITASPGVEMKSISSDQSEEGGGGFSGSDSSAAGQPKRRSLDVPSPFAPLASGDLSPHGLEPFGGTATDVGAAAGAGGGDVQSDVGGADRPRSLTSTTQASPQASAATANISFGIGSGAMSSMLSGASSSDSNASKYNNMVADRVGMASGGLLPPHSPARSFTSQANNLQVDNNNTPQPGGGSVAGAGLQGVADGRYGAGAYNTDEDEMIKKAVVAAEAAAAASADAESQSAVSEGLITRPALVAEFLSGCSLESAIRRRADFLNSDLVLTKVAMDAARGMEYCHAKRIIHWNLKTGNLIVGFSSDKVPLCKVADVGLSRPRQLNELDDAGVARVLPWTAPELVKTPDKATEKVDVYSFGMVMWSMWARKLPFKNNDIARVFLRMMQGHAVRPPVPGSPDWDTTFPGEVSPKEPAPGWCDLMQSCWSQDPIARPAFRDISQKLITMFNTAKAQKRAARAAAAKQKSDGGGGAA